jgi:hypothetical protein
MEKTLYELSIGKSGILVDFCDKNTKTLFEKFGLFIGRSVKCVSKSGTMIIDSGSRTLAVGKELALKVYIG